MKTLNLALLAGLSVAASMSSSAKAAPVSTSRPPQYVVLAFDGSKSLQMWNTTREFAKSETAAGRPLKFTYFINAAYYLADANKGGYDAPHAGRGKSAIGFGGSMNDVLGRFDQTNLAYQEGNEIANHAAGHFDGSKWSEMDWKNEFTQFYDIIFNIFSFNNAKPTRAFPRGWSFDQREITGFRAPQLGRNQGMYNALPQFGVQYDTSSTGKPSAWPTKRNNMWMFPLASIPVAGSGRHTLAMDYNFYYMQSGARSVPGKSADYEEQMYQSYINYFDGNYRGNRAPINIGHHFSLWNGGAYWRAMQRFAKHVCGLPEVKCVTYQELVADLDKMNPSQRASVESGNFEKATVATLGVDLKASFAAFEAPALPMGFDEDALMVMDPPEAHDE
jgi:hypothetical protein